MGKTLVARQAPSAREQMQVTGSASLRVLRDLGAQGAKVLEEGVVFMFFLRFYALGSKPKSQP